MSFGYFFAFSASAAIIGPGENRMTYAEYAAKNYGGNVDRVYEKFSAAGRLFCSGSESSGAVVRRDDLLIVAAHAFFHKDNNGRCYPNENLGRCYFQRLNKKGFGRRISILANTIQVSTNFKCDFSHDFSRDWAIVRLSDRVSQVRPFEPLSKREDQEYARLKRETITAFAAQTDNFKDGKSPSICDRKLGYIWTSNSHGIPQTNFSLGIECSMGHGASGGAVVVGADEASPTYIGLTTLGNDARFDSHWPFDIHNYTAGPFLQGEFYDTLMGM
jgi:hypothetical protein